MRNILMLVLTSLALTGCAAPPSPEPVAASLEELRASADGDVICDPWCDPTDPDPEAEATLSAAYSFAWSTYPDAIWRGQGCIDLDPGKECLVQFATSGSPCGPLTVDCVGSRRRGLGVRCDWLAAPGCD